MEHQQQQPPPRQMLHRAVVDTIIARVTDDTRYPRMARHNLDVNGYNVVDRQSLQHLVEFIDSNNNNSATNREDDYGGGDGTRQSRAAAAEEEEEEEITELLL
jgi:hypothetical protein